MLIREKEDEWDELDYCIPQIELLWIYGLLCKTEKPLLDSQASDINMLLNVLLKQREFISGEIEAKKN